MGRGLRRRLDQRDHLGGVRQIALQDIDQHRPAHGRFQFRDAAGIERGVLRFARHGRRQRRVYRAYGIGFVHDGVRDPIRIALGLIAFGAGDQDRRVRLALMQGADHARGVDAAGAGQPDPVGGDDGLRERDEGEREKPFEKYPWDGVSGVRPFAQLAGGTVVGVY